VRIVAGVVVMLGVTLAPPAHAKPPHDTVGGGTFNINSESVCTGFQVSLRQYEACRGYTVNVVNEGSYITVPLLAHSWVSCDTFMPDGQPFDHDTLSATEVPEHQAFWASHGWGPYNPQAICQLW
jgi:hypothetical protein